MTHLGYEVFQGRVRPKIVNVSAILEYPTPIARKALQRFPGMPGYYQIFCPSFTNATIPLTHFMSGALKYTWSDDYQATQESLGPRSSGYRSRLR